ncbi:hypothetical protein NP233_g8333 [Leucocoprinus birnbaumii]|uniref:TPR-like protein n=1 Tax=Leucocoprinus birnbaumii TaxID=56174 RepID=A0AAD5YP61_9AGAR|nr:hypothetical protein NP233_g8333 [Leucocoprinus birnbaumii]
MTEATTVRVPLTAESLPTEERIREANVRKAEGNDYFRKGDWQEALSAYESAIAFVPQGQIALQDERSSPPPDTSEEVRETEAEAIIEGEPILDPQPLNVELTEELQEKLDPEIERTCTTLRAILNANIGACHVKLGDHKLAVEACTKALKDDPKYVKALNRRAASNEILGSWSALTAVQEDYNTLLEILPVGKESKEIQNKLQKLKPRLEAAQKSETAEMMDKLKTLGNSFLGNFGLSTDNFKFVPNGQGGYSVNFERQ